MEISRADLEQAVSRGLLTRHQADELWTELERRAAARASAPSAPAAAARVRPRFDFVHVAYYFGALIVIGAMGWFMNVGWEKLGGGGIFAISCAYGASFVAAGRTLWRKEDLRTPGGLLVTMAVGMTPLAVYGLERPSCYSDTSSTVAPARTTRPGCTCSACSRSGAASPRWTAPASSGGSCTSWSISA